ncbi:hypothetical protein Pelo_16145 [Pelomyxa schiedti]|nr:hypothetical protein Pelo_16145 [Pelomyxa schiedti]
MQEPAGGAVVPSFVASNALSDPLLAFLMCTPPHCGSVSKAKIHMMWFSGFAGSKAKSASQRARKNRVTIVRFRVSPDTPSAGGLEGLFSYTLGNTVTFGAPVNFLEKSKQLKLAMRGKTWVCTGTVPCEVQATTVHQPAMWIVVFGQGHPFCAERTDCKVVMAPLLELAQCIIEQDMSTAVIISTMTYQPDPRFSSMRIDFVDLLQTFTGQAVTISKPSAWIQIHGDSETAERALLRMQPNGGWKVVLLARRSRAVYIVTSSLGTRTIETVESSEARFIAPVCGFPFWFLVSKFRDHMYYWLQNEYQLWDCRVSIKEQRAKVESEKAYIGGTESHQQGASDINQQRDDDKESEVKKVKLEVIKIKIEDNKEEHEGRIKREDDMIMQIEDTGVKSEDDDDNVFFVVLLEGESTILPNVKSEEFKL